MDRDELELYDAASRQELSIAQDDDGSWTLSAVPTITGAIDEETLLSGGLIRFADGRVFKTRMSTQELREALGLDPGA
jgi:hypothetical protein